MLHWFYGLALPAVAVAVGWGLWALPSKRTGWGVRLDVGLAWFSALATLVLVPVDITTALRGVPAPSQLSTWWRATYWYGFAVQVLVLPLHMEYTRRGEFSLLSRLAGALRYHLLYYTALLAVAASGVLLLLAAGRLAPSNVVGFCIAFSNAYGLIAAIFLLGFGLVAVPRALWHSADPAGEQRRLEHTAGMQAARAAEARKALSVAVLTTRRVGGLFSAHDPLRPQLEAVLSLANSVGPSFQASPDAEVPPDAELDYFDLPDLARLRRQVKKALKDYERERAIYIETVEAYLKAEATKAACAAGPPAGAGFLHCLAWAWRCHGHRWALRAAAVLAALLSLAMAVAEATISDVLPNSSLVSAALRGAVAKGSTLGAQCLAFLFLAYPCACAYYSVYRLGRFAFYRMVPRHTDAYSLCYSALLVCRFAAPLAFNFMAAVALPPCRDHSSPDVTDTVFYQQFGELMMRQPLIGWHFTTFAPALLVPYMLLLACGCFNRMAHMFKRTAGLEFEDDFATDSYTSAGRRLLRAESENAKNLLPLGLTIEPDLPGPGVSTTPFSAGAQQQQQQGVRSSLRAARGSSAGAGPAAALAGERASKPGDGQQQRRAWWQRLLVSRASGDDHDGSSVSRQGAPSPGRGARGADVQSARSRLLGTLQAGRGGGSTLSSPLTEQLLGREGRVARPAAGSGRQSRSSSTGGHGRRQSMDVEAAEGEA